MTGLRPAIAALFGPARGGAGVSITLALGMTLAAAARPAPAAEAVRRVLVCGPRTAILEIGDPAADGRVEWSHPANTREGWVLPDGNVLLALSRGDGGPGGAAVEIARGKDGAPDREVWRYDGTQEEINSIQKTPEGTYVLTEAGPNPRLLEIDAAGKVVVEFPLGCQKANGHMQTRMTRKQADGTYLAPHLFDFAIVRYDRSGKELARIGTRDPAAAALNTWPFTAITLPDGGILAGLTNGNRVVEFDRAGTIRWQIDTAETDGAIADACGVQRLPSGNTMIASYHVGKHGERLVEVSPSKEVVWAWRADVPAVHHFHLLEVDGAAIPWPPLR